MSWRGHCIKWMLALLNSRLFNQSPCSYGFIGNVDAFSMEFLISDVKRRPGLLVSELIGEADVFKSADLSRGEGLMIIRGSDVTEATDAEIVQLLADLDAEIHPRSIEPPRASL